jgi:hypothetical protein
MLSVRTFFAATLIATALGGFAVAQSQDPPPQAPPVPTEQQPDRTVNDQKQTNGEARPAEPAAQPAQHETSHQTQHAGEEASEFATLFGRKFKITDLLLVLFTAGLFIATIFLWLATRDLVADAKHNAERQLQAYIFPHELVVSNVELGKRPIANMLVKNTGLTPATDVIAWAGVWVGNFPLVAELVRATPEFMKTASRRSVGPGASFTINHAWNETLTEQHMQMLGSGTAAVFVWGEMTYVDMFGKKRTTSFRSYYGGDTGLRPGGATTTASEGNEAN